MKKVFTGVFDNNGVKIYSGDRVKYTYIRCSKVSYESTFVVEWGLDKEEQKYGWILGGSLLTDYGNLNNDKCKEILEVVY